MPEYLKFQRSTSRAACLIVALLPALSLALPLHAQNTPARTDAVPTPDGKSPATNKLFVPAPGNRTDWPQWRGPQRDGISPGSAWIDAFPKQGPMVAWKTNVGAGSSCVVLSQGVLVTMGNRTNQDHVIALNARTGQTIWEFTYPCALDRRSFEGGPAATPAIDGKMVYTLSHEGHLHALDLQTGKPVWSKHIVKDFQGQRPQWGFAGSPLIAGDKLILDLGGKGHSTLALNKTTGQTLWQSGDDEAGYASPILMGPATHPTVLLFKAKALVALDVATGKELWRFPWKTDYDCNIATPIVVDDQRIFISSGYNTGCALLRLTDGKPTQVWRSRVLRNHVATSVLWKDQIYGFDGQTGGGTLRCIDLADGRLRWSFNNLGAGTLMIAGGKLIVLSERGELLIAPADPAGFKPVSRAKILDGTCWVPPVLADDRLYLRNNNGDLVGLDLERKN